MNSGSVEDEQESEEVLNSQSPASLTRELRFFHHLLDVLLEVVVVRWQRLEWRIVIGRLVVAT